MGALVAAGCGTAVAAGGEVRVVAVGGRGRRGRAGMGAIGVWSEEVIFWRVAELLLLGQLLLLHDLFLLGLHGLQLTLEIVLFDHEGGQFTGGTPVGDMQIFGGGLFIGGGGGASPCASARLRNGQIILRHDACGTVDSNE